MKYIAALGVVVALILLLPVTAVQADRKHDFRGPHKEFRGPHKRRALRTPNVRIREKCHRRARACFEDIQEAIDTLLEQFPDGRRVIRFAPGSYEQQFEIDHLTGSTHLISDVPVPSVVSRDAAIVIVAPVNGVADANWRFAGRGSVSGLTFAGRPFEDGDIGILIDDLWLTELNFVDVGIVGRLGAGAHGIHLNHTLGFVQFYDVRAVLQCVNEISDADSAVLYLDIPSGPFHQFHWFGGELQAFGQRHRIAGCAALEAKHTTKGDDEAYTVFERLHLQAEGESTLIELDGDGVLLDFANNHYRAAPLGRFIEVKGSGSTSRVRFHGETRVRALTPSDWGNVIPEGIMNIFGDGEPDGIPCFPGRWTYYQNDGPPDTYDCTDFDEWTPR